MKTFLLETLFFITALVLEIVSILMIVDGLPESDLFTALCLHLTASLMTAIVLPKFLTLLNQAASPINLLLFFMITFYMPLLGMLGLVFAFVPGLRCIKNTSELPINFNRIREFPNAPFDQCLCFEYGAVSLENLLHSQNPDKRMNAVYATLKLDDKNAIPLLRTALRDPVDDIRLLAYALIDRKEHRISERIEQVRQSLENNEACNVRHLYKCIVKDYWELAHLGLVEGETLNYVLGRMRGYLEKALQLYPTDRGLHLQYAKLLLRLKETQLAYNEFKIAETLGIGNKSLQLYYAEIDFLQRRFGEVKRYMKEINLVKARPEIHAATRFWQGVPNV
jgi:tetratricopeptide (TPR) repeat protein